MSFEFALSSEPLLQEPNQHLPTNQNFLMRPKLLCHHQSVSDSRSCLSFSKSSTAQQSSSRVSEISLYRTMILTLGSFWETELTYRQRHQHLEKSNPCLCDTHLRSYQPTRLTGNWIVKSNFEFVFLVWEKPPYATLPDFSG